MENENLTEVNFAQHLNTKFSVPVNGRVFELELAEVKSYLSGPEEQQGMERFSIYFYGPPDAILPQNVYSMDHAEMGAFNIFIVPIARVEKGIRYEAVFNYYKSPMQ
jgi:hypothetical protein